jgi:hypothetical protein
VVGVGEVVKDCARATCQDVCRLDAPDVADVADVVSQSLCLRLVMSMRDQATHGHQRNV